jgi:hypothetical protein
VSEGVGGPWPPTLPLHLLFSPEETLLRPLWLMLGAARLSSPAQTGDMARMNTADSATVKTAERPGTVESVDGRDD